MDLMPGHFMKLFWTTADLLSHVSPNQTAAHARLGQLVPGLGWNRGVLWYILYGPGYGILSSTSITYYILLYIWSSTYGILPSTGITYYM